MTKTKYYMRWFFGILFFPLWILLILIKTYFEVKEEKRQKLREFNEAWNEANRDFIRKQNRITARKIDNRFNKRHYGSDESSAVCGDCSF